MRDITELLEVATEAEEGKMFWFLEFQFDAYQRYTDADIDIYLTTTSGGDHNKFASMPFSIPSISYSSSSTVDKLVIDIQNVDLSMSSTLLNEGVMNKWCVAWVAFFDGNNIIIGDPIEIFRGLVSTWKLKESKASITLVNEAIFWNKKTLRRHQSACTWTFKGVECGYSGVYDWCDQGYTRCLALGNQDNFGGHRFLPTLTEQEIYWGKTTGRLL